MQNRKIEFRGKNTINGNWVKGYYFVDEGIHKIHSGHTIYPVHPKTVGQNTGLKDKNGVDVFEGDLVKDIIVGAVSEIIYTDYANFGLKCKSVRDLEYDVIDPAWSESSLEIIGNTIDNPELLKQ